MSDQTQFFQEEALYQSSDLPELPETKPEEPAQPWFKQPKKLGLAVAAALLAIVILMIVSLMLFADSNPTQEPDVTFPSRTTQPTTVTPLEKRLQEVKVQLRQADPAQDKLPFPPVILNIGLNQE